MKFFANELFGNPEKRIISGIPIFGETQSKHYTQKNGRSGRI